MFPDYLDGARVLEYTDRGHYGLVTDFNEDDLPIEKEICYYAIAQYKEGGSFYLFSCDGTPEVFGDSTWDSPEEIKSLCPNLPEDIVWHKKE